MNKLDWENDFKDYFHPSWHRFMQPVIESDWMYNIYNVLVHSQEKVLPASSEVFKSFTGNFDDIHTVLVLSDPYPWVKNDIIVADGIPMSCSHTNVQQPSLVKFYEAMKRELKDKELFMSTDLKYLIEQGCFLVNTALTVKRNKVGSHQALWKPFTKYLFEDILSEKQGIVYWLMGNEAKAFKGSINLLGNYIVTTTHPANAAYNNSDWDSNGTFIKINNVIRNNFGSSNEIIWNETEYHKQLEETPF